MPAFTAHRQVVQLIVNSTNVKPSLCQVQLSVKYTNASVLWSYKQDFRCPLRLIMCSEEMIDHHVLGSGQIHQKERHVKGWDGHLSTLKPVNKPVKPFWDYIYQTLENTARLASSNPSLCCQVHVQNNKLIDFSENIQRISKHLIHNSGSSESFKRPYQH